jgi:shikimate dehydrogenase
MGLVLLIGSPVSHSLSPQLQNAGFRHLALELRYEARETRPTELETLVEQVRHGTLSGANVTVPFKEQVLPLLDRISSSSALLGAVNTLVHDGGEAVGHNTDVTGLVRVFSDLLGSSPPTGALVLGVGGAARAAVLACAQARIPRVHIANRDGDRSKALAVELGRHVASELVGLPLSGLTRLACELVIHATSAGLGAHEGSARHAEAVAFWKRTGCVSPATRVAIDVAYGREATPFVQAARDMGVPASDGLAMLLYQGLASFGLWTGRAAPDLVMRDALLEAAGRRDLYTIGGAC